MVVWLVPVRVPASHHDFKYTVVYVRNEIRVVGYDNERGKGEHKHLDGAELPYLFTTIAQLLIDFETDVTAIRGEPI